MTDSKSTKPFALDCFDTVDLCVRYKGYQPKRFRIFKLAAFHDLFLFPSVRSTNIVRTIESAKCLVAGLFQQKQDGRVEFHMCMMLLLLLLDLMPVAICFYCIILFLFFVHMKKLCTY